MLAALALLAPVLAGCATVPLAASLSARPAPEIAPSVEILSHCPLPATAIDAAEAPVGTRDLWQRLRRGFVLAPSGHPRVETQLRWYAAHPAYLDRVVDRARRYLHHIAEEVERRRLPQELALLPVVESAFDPYAYSHGRAAGLWQFIPGTGRRYGLEQDWWHDERRDVLESTRAALDYLEDLHRSFDGDWLLALAAYNSGIGNVRRAIRENRARGASTGFFALDLPRETEAYVPKLLALQRLVAEPDAYGVALGALPDRPYFETVALDGQLDLARAVELSDVPMEELYRLNAGLNRWATHPEGPHRLLVPAEAAGRLREGLAELPDGERVAWQRHRIRPGESLSEIAHAYGTSAAALKRANRLQSDVIRAGDALLIPVASAADDRYALSERGRQRRRDDYYGEGRRQVRYRVRPGDSLWTIARAHDLDVNRIARWNGIARTEVLRAGTALTLWLPEAREAAPPSRREDVVRRLGYRVRRGDSLSRIAARFAISVEDIVRWNTLERDAYLQPGQRLTLFVDVRRAP